MRPFLVLSVVSMLFSTTAYSKSAEECEQQSLRYDICYEKNEKKIESFIDKKYDKCRFKCFWKTYKTWKTCTRGESDFLQQECDNKCGDIEWDVPYCRKELKTYNKCMKSK